MAHGGHVRMVGARNRTDSYSWPIQSRDVCGPLSHCHLIDGFACGVVEGDDDPLWAPGDLYGRFASVDRREATAERSISLGSTTVKPHRELRVERSKRRDLLVGRNLQYF